MLVRQEDDHVEVAPDELWLEESRVGVVRLVLGDEAVVDASWTLEISLDAQRHHAPRREYR